jgi:transcriptional regulator with XRE-family HTH domain
MANQNIPPKRWRQQREMTMAGVALMLGIVGKNPSRTWQRYENGEREPPISIVAKLEMISDGAVSTASWMQVRQAFVSKNSEV